MPTLSSLKPDPSVLSIRVHPEGAVTLVLSPPLNAIPAIRKSPREVDEGVKIVSVVVSGGSLLFAPDATEPKSAACVIVGYKIKDMEIVVTMLITVKKHNPLLLKENKIFINFLPSIIYQKAE